MSRDFVLVLGGGVVSLVTTLIVLFVADWVYRRDQNRQPDKRSAAESLEPERSQKEMNTQTNPNQ